MVVETEVLPFFEWFPQGILQWLLVALVLGVVALAGGFFLALLRYGPWKAAAMTGKLLCAAAGDLLRISPRRVGALTWLAVKESIRRRVVVVFAVFIVLLLFAGWFLDPGSINPARLYLSFVLTSTSYLVLLLVLFLSVFSLPADLKNRTLHTIVTKPVRPSEIVLGRMLGFTVLGTVLLAAMCFISYWFVVRGLNHTHEVDLASLKPLEIQVEEGQNTPMQGRSTKVNNHWHKVVTDVEGQGRLETERGHWHPLAVKKSGEKTVYQVGLPEGMLVARVPIYGKIRFTDRSGRPAKKGINVGDEWTYRSYIEGGTLASAVWTFEGITEEKFPDGLPLELTLGVFRTYKGNIEKGIPGSLSIRSPKTGQTVEAKIFSAKEFMTDSQHIPRSLRTADGESLDLFEDLVADGRVEIILRCVQPAQYFGAAQPDLYLRARNASFAFNFVKGYFGIWMQMVLVIGFGVMFSTFLSGPVAMLATMGTLLGGFFSNFMMQLAKGETYGGGPVESLIRLVTQQNVVTEMEPGLRTTVAKMMDVVLGGGLWAMASILPNFGKFSCANYVAYGFNIPPDWILQRGLTTLGFMVLLFVAGYLFLKTREVAR